MAELKALSKLKMAGKLRYWRGTIEIDEHELHAICDEIQAEYDKAVAAMNKAAGNWAHVDKLLRGLLEECESCPDTGCTRYIETVVKPDMSEQAATLGAEINGDTSDGYHTFNELYHHRAVLFSVIVRDHRELAWKAKKHHDGTMYDGMFIVGVDTPQGQATYHYDIDPYWDMFDCRELESAPEWDGHTPDEAIERIATLGAPSIDEPDTIRNEFEDNGYSTLGADDGSRWSELFGTPERAARVIVALNNCRVTDCIDCWARGACKYFGEGGEYDTLLEWLRGEGE